MAHNAVLLQQIARDVLHYHIDMIAHSTAFDRPAPVTEQVDNMLVEFHVSETKGF